MAQAGIVELDRVIEDFCAELLSCSITRAQENTAFMTELQSVVLQLQCKFFAQDESSRKLLRHLQAKFVEIEAMVGLLAGLTASAAAQPQLQPA